MEKMNPVYVVLQPSVFLLLKQRNEGVGWQRGGRQHEGEKSPKAGLGCLEEATIPVHDHTQHHVPSPRGVK